MERDKHIKTWPEYGKEFAVFLGKCSIAGLVLGASIYVGGRGAVEKAVNPTIEAQGNKLNRTMEDRVKDIEEIKDVASKVDKRLDGISEDWEILKEYLETEFNIVIETPEDKNG
jgi:hypothetical protein